MSRRAIKTNQEPKPIRETKVRVSKWRPIQSPVDVQANREILEGVKN